MFRLALVTLTVALTAVTAQEDGPFHPNANPTDTTQLRLLGKEFPFNQLPFMADTSPPTPQPDGGDYRGPQAGYNNCTGRASSQDAKCQTLIVNSIDDFCLWAPPEPNSISNSEGEVVAWCTKPTHGARVIPAGTLTGVQFIKAKSYVEVTGFINQANIDITGAEGTGGELDSGGQDGRGNPMGGLAYSNNLPHSTGTMTQSNIWHLFIGNGMFCMKLCDNQSENPVGICRHTLDTVGCNINVPAAYVPNVFESCESDDQAPVALGVTAIPASSSCKQYQSTELYPVTSGIPTATAAPSSSTTAAPTGSVSGSGSVTLPGTTTRGTTSGANPTGTNQPDAAVGRTASALGVFFASLIGLVVVV